MASYLQYLKGCTAHLWETLSAGILGASRQGDAWAGCSYSCYLHVEFICIDSLLDFSVVALPENVFCGCLHPGLDGAFSIPTSHEAHIRLAWSC